MNEALPAITHAGKARLVGPQQARDADWQGLPPKPLPVKHRQARCRAPLPLSLQTAQ